MAQSGRSGSGRTRGELCRLLVAMLAAGWAGCAPSGDEPRAPGVRLVRPAPEATVPLVFEALLQVTGQAESAGLELYKGEGAAEPLKTVACEGSCQTNFSHASGTYEVRGWAVIEGQRYETPRHRVTVDPVPLAVLFSRLRAPGVLEVRFNKPISADFGPDAIRLTRSIPANGYKEQDTRDTPLFQTELENDNRTLLVKGTFGMPALLSLALKLMDSRGAWPLEQTLEFTQGYFTDLGQIENVFLYTQALLFDREGRAIISIHVPNARRILRREANGSWTNLIAGDAVGACLSSPYDGAVLGMDDEGRLLSICGVEAQIVRYEGGRWVNLGTPRASRTIGRALAVDGQGRPVVLLSHYNGATERLSLERYENGAWTLLAQQLNDSASFLGNLGFVRAPGGALLVFWEEGHGGGRKTAYTHQVTESTTVPVPWATKLSLLAPSVDDGAGGWWMAAQETDTARPLILQWKRGEAAPTVISRDVPLPAGAVLFREQDDHLAVFGYEFQQVGSSQNDPGDPNSSYSPIYASMMTLRRLDGGAWGPLPGAHGHIMERAIQEYRLVEKVARGPDGVIYALLSQSWLDASRVPFVKRSRLLFVRR